MSTKLPIFGLLWFAGWTLVLTRPVHARDLDQATSLYSQGVHAYFAGRFSDTESLLSQAIAIHDRDPRFYFFRALSRLRIGRDSEARRDMAAGAELEATQLNRYALGTALQRVQGNHRLLLEQYRRDARSRAVSIASRSVEQHGQQMNRRDEAVLREPVIIPLEALLSPGTPEALSADEAAHRAAAVRSAPVRSAPAVSVKPVVEAPAGGAAPSAEDDPFRDDTAPEAPATAADSSPPASSEPSPSAEAPPAENAEVDDNPFDF